MSNTGSRPSARSPEPYSPEDIANRRKLRRPGLRLILMVPLFFAAILPWFLFWAYVNSKEKALEPYGMPFGQWFFWYLVVWGIVLVLVIILAAAGT